MVFRLRKQSGMCSEMTRPVPTTLRLTLAIEVAVSNGFLISTLRFPPTLTVVEPKRP